MPEPSEPTRIELAYTGVTTVQEVTVNGQTVPFVRQADRILIGLGTTEIQATLLPRAVHALEVFPNPFAEHLTIRTSAAPTGLSTVAVFNVLGQRVQVLRGAIGERTVAGTVALLREARCLQGCISSVGGTRTAPSITGAPFGFHEGPLSCSTPILARQAARFSQLPHLTTKLILCVFQLPPDSRY